MKHEGKAPCTAPDPGNVLSLLLWGQWRAGETYQKITSADELTTGKYVMVVDSGYAPSVYSSDWLTAVQVQFILRYTNRPGRQYNMEYYCGVPESN